MSTNPSPYPEGGPGRHLKARLAAGEVLVCAMVTEYVRPSLMKLYGHAGIDFVFFEYEHTYFSPTALADTVLAARDNGLPPIAKTPQLERQEVAKLLECGVVGIQLPRTESRAQIEELRRYLKFSACRDPRHRGRNGQQRLLSAPRSEHLAALDGRAGCRDHADSPHRDQARLRESRGDSRRPGR